MELRLVDFPNAEQCNNRLRIRDDDRAVAAEHTDEREKTDMYENLEKGIQDDNPCG
jgi:hypothetical protein